MHNRLFTFGCSFTRYLWPTWADIVSKNYTFFENWGMPGAGNMYIFNSLTESILRNNISSNDTVIVMWSSPARDDIYVNSKWKCGKGAQHQDYNDRWYTIRDIALMHAAKKMLEQNNITYYFLSMIPVNHVTHITDNTNIHEIHADIFNIYSEVNNCIKPSVLEKIFNFNWDSRPQKSGTAPAAERSYNDVKGIDWPLFSDVLNNNFDNCLPEIIEELNDTKWIWKKILSNGERVDMHPTPLEHLEYLNLVLPEFKFSQDTIDWVIHADNAVTTHIKNHNSSQGVIKDLEWDITKNYPKKRL